ATPAGVGALLGVADRTRGLGATLALARAQGATTGVVAVLAGTVAVALVVLAGTVLHTVRVGQRDAAAALVVGDVRVDGALPARLADDLRAAPGVTHVAQGAQLPGRALGTRTGATATLLVVDAVELAAVRTSAGLPVDPALAALADAGAGAVPALLSPDLADRLEGVPLRLGVLDGSVDLELRGTTALTPDPGAPATDGRAAPVDAPDDDGLVVVDRAALAAATTAPAVDRLWAAGPGAEPAVTATDVDLQEGVEVTTRDGWWRAWSGSALTGGLTSLLAAGTALLLLDLVLVLVLVAVASAPARGRTLSALRTLGLDARTAAWATAGELAPLAAGALVGGTLIGLALPLLVGDALGLTLLTGEPQTAAVRWTPWPVALAAAATLAALAVAVVAEQAVRRRDRLGEVLRVGER
ncbi:FtsX-like permease family protein, partial [Cellulomonas oligotrophica]|uniref:FtsX-like permease family protein n=1 Tax=Cellulomonas oligotrophica TaxID=931536 RepID=UPI0031F0024E